MPSWVAALLAWGATKAVAPLMAEARAMQARNFMVMGYNMARGGCVVVMIDVAFAFVDVAPLLCCTLVFAPLLPLDANWVRSKI
jgi:hypothetical protein